ncbi:MAG: HAMP domain-containing histidine kinase [Simkaniaceae bacterium]|nr:HAMP domain-containing histidine kinase [Simkaniaceae bacterium]
MFRERQIKLYALISSTIVALAGAIICISWKLNIISVFQVSPDVAPTQFNTALLFLTSGIGIIFFLRANRLGVVCFGGLTAIFSLASFLQYYFNINLGLDELFHTAQITTKSSHPGRMAPNTAICFILLNIGVLLKGFKHEQNHYWFSSCLAVIVFSFGLVSIFGYLTNLEDAYGWQKVTDMSPQTSIGFILAGISLFFSTITYEETGNISPWIVIPIMVTTLMIAILLWRAIEVERIQTITRDQAYYSNPLASMLLAVSVIITIYMQKRIISFIDSIDRAKFNLEVTSNAKTNILRYVSHEIRNPLNAVIGFSEPFIDDNKISKDSKEAFDCIYSASMHIKQIVDDLLAISRFDSGKIYIEPHEYIVQAWLSEVVKPLKLRAEKQQIVLDVQLDTSVPETLRGDSSKLAQIIINLVENAYKYTPQQGKVTIYLFLDKEENQKEWLNIEISDTGRGIPESIHKELFKPFFQSRKSDEIQGLGLGLSICKKFLDMMGGQIRVESSEGKGTKFIVKVGAYI